MSSDGDDRLHRLFCTEKFCDELFARRCPPLTTEDLRCFYLLLKDESSRYRWPPFEQLMEAVKNTAPDPTDVVEICEHYICMVCCLVFRAWASFCGHLRATEHLNQAKVVAKEGETNASEGRATRRCPLKDCRTKCASDKRLLDHLRTHPHFLLAVKEVPKESTASVSHACLQCGLLFSSKQKATTHAKSCGGKRSQNGATDALRATFSSDAASIDTTSESEILLKALKSKKKVVLNCRLENQTNEALTIRGVEVCSELSNFYLNNKDAADTASRRIKATSDVIAPGNSHVTEFVAQLEAYGFYEGSLRITYQSGTSKAICFLHWTVNLEVISEDHDLLLPSSRFVAKKPEPWIDAPTVPGPPPPSCSSKLELRIPLKGYPIPQHLRLMAQQNKISEDRRQLSKECYQDKMSRLLHLEEIAQEEAMRLLTIPSASMQRDGQMFLLEVPRIADEKTVIKVGDCVKVFFLNSNLLPDTSLSYAGTVHCVDRRYLSLKFDHAFGRKYTNGSKFRIEFPLDRWQLKTLHRAVERTAANNALMESVLFPTSVPDGNDCEARTPSDKSLKLYNSRVANNPEQLRAVKAIVSGRSSPHPYLIFGPPGTGKTTTVVEAIKQVYLLKPKSRQLICTPQNNAADLIAERLLEHLPPVDVMRINAFSRKKASILSTQVTKVSNFESSDAAYMPSVEELFRKRVIVCTLSTSSRFVTAALGRKFFSHIVIDESGQALEPETMIPLTDLLEVSSAKRYGQLVLAGDPKQLGPVLQSAIAKRSGLGTSLLERLMSECNLYKKQETSNAYDSRFVTKLVRNFRSHPDILTIPNELFYDGELEPHAQIDEREKFCSWEELPRMHFPIIMHGVIGRDHREGDNPSYFNIAEAEMVAEYVTKLLCLKTITVKPSDIGIISPYAQQASKIRRLLKTRLSATSMKGTNVDDIQTGTAEKFQGQERPVIIISTVRTEKSLGFVSDAKRFNVALTRAKSLLIVVGNPEVLSQDVYWKRFIEYCRERGGLRDLHLRSYHAGDIATATMEYTSKRSMSAAQSVDADSLVLRLNKKVS